MTPTPSPRDVELEARVRAACCPEHGLGPDGLERHVTAIVNTVQRTRRLRPNTRRRRVT